MINRAITALLTMSLAASAIAQDAEPAEEIREFNVEVIIFAYAQDVSVGTEIFVPDEIPAPKLDDMGDDIAPEERDTLPVLPQMPPEQEEDSDDTNTVPDFTILTTSDLKMQDIADRMRRLDVYDVLVHAGWTQAARSKDEAITMNLEMLAPLPPNLSGEFTLYLSRFLHLVADLTLGAPGNASIPVAIERPRDPAFDRLAAPVGPVNYRIIEDRIFRSDETRYYDHPKFGIVARVTRYEPPEPEVDEALPGSATRAPDTTN